MKKWPFVFLCILIIGVGWMEIQAEDDLKEVEGVSVIVQDNQITSTGAVFSLQNRNSDCAFWFSDGCSLQRRLFGKWLNCISIRQTASTADSFILLPEESIEHEVGWKNKYGSLSSGDYRIKIRMEKMISDGNDYNIMDGEYILYIPFSL